MMMVGLVWAALLAAGALSSPARGDGPPSGHAPEVLEMFWSIVVNGADMGPGQAWFHPSRSRYTFPRLASRRDPNGDGRITPDELGAGTSDLFDRLDRDHDGAITASDLDTSPASPRAAAMAQARQRFAMLDADGSGKVDREEFAALFDRVSQGKDYLSPEDIATVFGPMSRPQQGQRPTARPAGPPPGMPDRKTLLAGLFSGEIGSAFEGPGLGTTAPDFELPTIEGLARVRLRDLIGPKPVVLIFGSFT
jgi:hypothetical protein